MLLSADGSEMHRLAQTRTLRFTTDTYWASSRAAVSPDAKHVLFDSNFGVPGVYRSVLVDVLAKPGMQADDNSVPALGTTFTLINADTDQPVPGFDPMPAEVVIDRAALNLYNFSIRANPHASTTTAVEFIVNGTSYRKESVVPYALYGDTNGDYNRWPAAVGVHNVVGKVYEGLTVTETPSIKITVR
jgi:hypothetical protein